MPSPLYSVRYYQALAYNDESDLNQKVVFYWIVNLVEQCKMENINE